MKAEDYFKIGYVAKTHGLKGEVTVISEPVSPDWKELNTVFLQIRQNLVPYFVHAISFNGDKVLVKFDEVDSIDKARLLKGCGIYLSKASRPALKRGEFYDDEVVGFEVESDDGNLGAVREVVLSGANRLLAIDHQGKEIFIPVNGPFIKSVNKSKKKILVDLPEGFLDI